MTTAKLSVILCAALFVGQVAVSAAGCRKFVKLLGPIALDFEVGSSVSAAELATFNDRSRLCRTLHLLNTQPPSHVNRLLGSEEGDEVWLTEDFCKVVERLKQSSGGSIDSLSSSDAVPATRLPVLSPGYLQLIGCRIFSVIQQRQSGEVAFNKTWDDYVNGFGTASEFWIGLEKMTNKTSNHARNLRIEVVTVDEEFYAFEALSFTVGDSSTNYRMDYSSFVSGSSTINCDFLSRNRGQQFSTFDRDNDAYSRGSCSARFGSGGYWWNRCMNSNPNGQYSSTLISGSTKASHMATRCIGIYKTLLAIRMMLQV